MQKQLDAANKETASKDRDLECKITEGLKTVLDKVPPLLEEAGKAAQEQTSLLLAQFEDRLDKAQLIVEQLAASSFATASTTLLDRQSSQAQLAELRSLLESSGAKQALVDGLVSALQAGVSESRGQVTALEAQLQQTAASQAALLGDLSALVSSLAQTVEQAKEAAVLSALQTDAHLKDLAAANAATATIAHSSHKRSDELSSVRLSYPSSSPPPPPPPPTCRSAY